MRTSLYRGATAVCFAAATAATAFLASAPAFATQVVQPAAIPPKAPQVVDTSRVSFDLKWPDYPGADHYEVRYGSRSDFADAQTVAKYRSRNIGGLNDATTYYLQYRAVTREGQGLTGWSETLKAATLAYFPGQFTSIKIKGGQDSITVSWNPTAYTTHYSVKIADDLDMKRNARTFRNIKGSSYTIPNVSNRSRSAMPNFIRVYAHNKDAATRTSKRYTAYAAAPRVAGKEQVSVASWNVLCAVCKGDPGTNPPKWTKRIGILEKTIRSKRPDILLLQEAKNYKVPGASSTNSMDDLAKRLKKAGYALDRKPEKTGTDHYSNRIAYSTEKFKLVKKGTFALPKAKGANKRGATWVLLKSKETGSQFYALSYHVDPNIPLTGKNSKADTMKRIDAKMASLNKKNLPVIVGGDANTDYYQLPSNAPHETMMALGWTDAASSAKKTNYMYSTFNGYHNLNKSWGRIDYIFTKGIQGTVSYENVLDVDSKGRLRSTPGSDHNMIVAKVKLP